MSRLGTVNRLDRHWKALCKCWPKKPLRHYLWVQRVNKRINKALINKYYKSFIIIPNLIKSQRTIRTKYSCETHVRTMYSTQGMKLIHYIVHWYYLQSKCIAYNLSTRVFAWRRMINFSDGNVLYYLYILHSATTDLYACLFINTFVTIFFPLFNFKPHLWALLLYCCII